MADDPAFWDSESFQPGNKLERALVRASHDPTRHPAMWRALWREQVHFLMPYHPEMEGMAQIREGEELPLLSWSDQQGQYVPIFTSPERVPSPGRHGAPAFCLGSMPGEVLFRFLAPLKLRVILNANHTPNLVIQPTVVQSFANGEMHAATKPEQERSPEDTLLRTVPPETYPELAKALRAHCDTRPVLAGLYLFNPVELSTDKADEDDLRLVLWAKRRDEAFFHDLGIIARASHPPVSKLSVGVVDHTNAEGIAFLQKCQPLWPVLTSVD